jgi:hypothetical protein
MKHIKSYKIYESGEWSKNIDWNYVKENPDDDSDEVLLIKYLEERLYYISSMLDNDNILEIIDIRGHDLYQGAYAMVNIFGKKYKIWNVGAVSGGVEDTLYIEGFPINNMNEDSNPGFLGDTEEIYELLNDIYINEGDIELYKTTKKYNI